MTPASLLLCAVLVAPEARGTVPIAGVSYFQDLQAADRAFGEQRYAAAESLYARIAEPSQDAWVWLRLGQSRVRQKKYREAAEAFRRAVPLGTKRSAEGARPFMEYRVARSLALAGERDSALAWLDRAIRDGYEDRADIAEDESFASVRDDPRFSRLAGRLSGNLARDAGWRYDLAFLVAEIRRMHVRYRLEPLPAGFESDVRALDREIPRLTDTQIYFRLQRLMARLGDGHSVLYPFGERIKLLAIPIGFYHFSDGWYIVEAPDSLRTMVGRQLLAMDGVPMDTLAKRLGPVMSRDNPRTGEWIGPLYLQLGDLIATLAGEPDHRHVRITLADSAGHREQVTLLADQPLRPRAPRLRAPGAGTPPLWLRDVETPFRLSPLPRPRSLYVQFNQVADADSETLEDFALRLRSVLARDSIRDLVVDVRHNNGGNGYLMGELKRTLTWFTANDRRNRLFVLMGRGTFSAAQVFINQLDLDARPIFAGEPSSSRPDFPGEDTSVRLPWSGIHGSISSRYHMVDGADTRIWIAPEIPVALSSRDYFANRDPVLDAVLKVMQQGP